MMYFNQDVVNRTGIEGYIEHLEKEKYVTKWVKDVFPEIAAKIIATDK